MRKGLVRSIVREERFDVGVSASHSDMHMQNEEGVTATVTKMITVQLMLDILCSCS